MDVHVHGTIALRAAQQGPKGKPPAQGWPERHRWGMAIGGGLTVAPVAGIARLLLARLREPPVAGSTLAAPRAAAGPARLCRREATSQLLSRASRAPPA